MRFDIRARRDARHDRQFLPIRSGARWVNGILTGAAALVDVEDEFEVVQSIRNCGRITGRTGSFLDNSGAASAVAFGVGDVSPAKNSAYFTSLPKAAKAKPTRPEAQQVEWERKQADDRRAAQKAAEVAWAEAEGRRKMAEARLANAVPALPKPVVNLRQISCLPLGFSDMSISAEINRFDGTKDGEKIRQIIVGNRFYGFNSFSALGPKEDVEQQFLAWRTNNGMIELAQYFPELPDSPEKLASGRIWWAKQVEKQS